MIGLPGETEDDILQTIRFAKELECDFASFNTAVARMNTHLRKDALQRNLIDNEIYEMDQSGDYGIINNETMTSERIRDLRNKAVREFYFRVPYIFRRILGIRTWYELKSHIKNGLAIWSKI